MKKKKYKVTKELRLQGVRYEKGKLLELTLPEARHLLTTGHISAVANTVAKKSTTSTKEEK